MSISPKTQDSAENRLLAALPDEVFDCLLPHLQPASFALGGVVYESSEQMEHLYFPTTCIVSLLLHTVEQRLCRWLLLTHDRVESAELWLTQEFIANMLGGVARVSPRRRAICKQPG